MVKVVVVAGGSGGGSGAGDVAGAGEATGAGGVGEELCSEKRGEMLGGAGRRKPGTLRFCGDGVEMDSARGGVGGGSILQLCVFERWKEVCGCGCRGAA